MSRRSSHGTPESMHSEPRQCCSRPAVAVLGTQPLTSGRRVHQRMSLYCCPVVDIADYWRHGSTTTHTGPPALTDHTPGAPRGSAVSTETYRWIKTKRAPTTVRTFTFAARTYPATKGTTAPQTRDKMFSPNFLLRLCHLWDFTIATE